MELVSKRFDVFRVKVQASAALLRADARGIACGLAHAQLKPIGDRLDGYPVVRIRHVEMRRRHAHYGLPLDRTGRVAMIVYTRPQDKRKDGQQFPKEIC